MKELSVVVERDEEGFYVRSAPALPGCHTQAKSLDKLMKRVKEAIALYLEVVGERVESLEFVGVQRVAVEPMTHLPTLTGRQLVCALGRAAFEVIRVGGSHHFLRHPDGWKTVVPVHAH